MSTADDATGATRFDQARTRVLDWSARLKQDFDAACARVLGAGRGCWTSPASSRSSAEGRGDLADPRP